MGKIKSLEDVNALALPAKVLVLLSKYAQTLRETNGIVIKLSSLRIFVHVHATCTNANTPRLTVIYNQLLQEVNEYIEAGVMFTNEEKAMLLNKKDKERTLNKHLPKTKESQRTAQA